MFQDKKKWVGLMLIVLTLGIIMSTPFQQFSSMPDEVRIFEGKSTELALTLPTSGTVESENLDIVQVASTQNSSSNHAVHALKSGTAGLQFKLGNIPIKNVKVDVLPDVKVYPGGQSIGVKLNAVGPLVVGHHFINKDDDTKVSPGEKANIQIGDMIISINDQQVKSLKDIGKIVQREGEQGNQIDLQLLRGKDKVNVSLDPILDEKEDQYRLGLYLRHSAAGVGTLTFTHPKSGAYGALGHVISDVDTQRPIVVGDGNIVESDVSSIEKGTRGNPGEKFSNLKEDDILGNVKRNTPYGIFGTMNQEVKNGINDKPISIGLSEDVQKGPAHILTVVEDEQVEKFNIEVVDVVDQDFPATKGLVIKVTDEQLLEKTGGIVQGMSGSPIIQDGKLIGAVTHVFVNDPTSGYGCLIEWMLEDAGISVKPKEQLEQESKDNPEQNDNRKLDQKSRAS